MAMTATRIATLAYDAARRRFEAVVEFFSPGLPQPMRIPVRVSAPPSIGHRRLVRGLVHEAQRQILR